MSEYLIQEETLTGIADAIRAKGHSYADRNNDIVVSDMAGRIRKLDNLKYAVYVSNTFNAIEVNNMYNGVRDNIIWIKPILDGTIFDVEHLNLYIHATTGVVTAASTNTVYTKYIKCIPNTNYTFVLDDAQTVLIAGFDKLPATGVTGTIIYGAGKTNAETTLEYTVNSGEYEYLGIWYYDSSVNGTIPNITIKYEDLDGIMWFGGATYDYVISHNRPSNIKDGLIWIKNGNCNSERAFNAVNDSMQYIQGEDIDSNRDDGAIMINPVSVKVCKLLNGEYVWVNPAEARLICPGWNYDIKDTESMKDEIAELIEGELVNIENEDVTKVRDHGFFRYNNLNSVNFQNCNSVGSSAFAYCSSLTTAWLPKCASFGTSAFYSCTKIQNAALGLVSFVSGHPIKNASKALVNVELPYCTNISNSAFTGHTALETVSAPIVDTINANAFQSCTSLKEVTLGLTTVDSTNHKLSQVRTTLETINFPRCTELNGGFSGSIKFATDGVTFNYSYNNLKNANFPECTTITNGAFFLCSQLTSVSFPKCTTINTDAFALCTKLTNVYFPECTIIDDGAFAGTGLTSASFPKCITIGNSAFAKTYTSTNNFYPADCLLSSVYFPECTTIGTNAFESCSKLTSVSFPKCTTIGSYAFNNCSNLISVYFPECTTIGNNAFSNMYVMSDYHKLSSVSFPKCTTIGNYAFINNTNLTSVYFPKCTTIGNSAFNNCSKLTSVSFPECTTIGSYAFCSCSNLTMASFPKCTIINNSAFANCSNLTSVYFPECTTIGTNAFRSCSKLTMVSFPKCITISTYAFYSCSKLAALYLKSTLLVTLGASSAFYGTPMSLSTLTGKFGSIYVPASLVSAYKTAANWSAYAARITAIP